jgi:hypothetical protein
MEPVASAGATGLAAKVIASTLGVGRHVARNDTLARRAFEDVTDWVRDEHQRLRRDLSTIDERTSRENTFWGGHRIKRRNERKEESLYAWRDRDRAHRRRLEDLRATEIVVHRLWRWIRRRPWPTNGEQREINSIVAIWATPELDPGTFETELLLRHIRDGDAGSVSVANIPEPGGYIVVADRGIDRRARVLEYERTEPKSTLIFEWEDE